MPPVKLKYIVFFSSQDEKHPAENLLGGDPSRRWLSHSSDRSGRIQVEFHMDPCTISHLDIGAYWALTVQVEVGLSSWPRGAAYKTLLPPVPFMTPIHSRKGEQKSCMKMFKQGDFSESVRGGLWDRVRVTCMQPFRKDVQFGLNLLKIFSQDDQCTSQKVPGHLADTAVGSDQSDKTPEKTSEEIQRHFFGQQKSPNLGQNSKDLHKKLLVLDNATEQGSPALSNLSRTSRIVMTAAKKTPLAKKLENLSPKPKTHLARKPVNAPSPTLQKSGSQTNNSSLTAAKHGAINSTPPKTKSTLVKPNSAAEKSTPMKTNSMRKLNCAQGTTYQTTANSTLAPVKPKSAPVKLNSAPEKSSLAPEKSTSFPIKLNSASGKPKLTSEKLNFASAKHNTTVMKPNSTPAKPNTTLNSSAAKTISSSATTIPPSTKHHTAGQSGAQTKSKKAKNKKQKLESEIQDFLSTVDVKTLDLEKFTFADLRHGLERKLRRKLTKKERKQFLVLAKNHISENIDDAEENNQSEDMIQDITVTSPPMKRRLVDTCSESDDRLGDIGHYDSFEHLMNFSPLKVVTPSGKIKNHNQQMNGSGKGKNPKKSVPSSSAALTLPDGVMTSSKKKAKSQSFEWARKDEGQSADNSFSTASPSKYKLISSDEDDDVQEIQIQDCKSFGSRQAKHNIVDVVTMGMCPICSQSFPCEVLNQHADHCASSLGWT